jgi:hypothetical protein
MKKIFLVFLLMYNGIFSQAQNSQNTNFDQLIRDLKSSQEPLRLRILDMYNFKKLSTAKAKKILTLFSKPELKLKAFSKLTNLIKENSDKESILQSFKNENYSIKREARTIFQSISDGSEENYFSNSNDLKGKIVITRKNYICEGYKNYKTFFEESDQIMITYYFNKQVETTKATVWTSSCKTPNRNSCRTPFREFDINIYPDRNYVSEGYYHTFKFLEELEEDLHEGDNWFQFSVIIKDKIVSNLILSVRRGCE